ncbi:MAG: HAD family hydrolase [Chloroflexi bacterium]|nr:HAD family hydrolase [Chloroflexota bacterium]
MIKGIFFDAADVFYRRPQRTDEYVANLLQANGFTTELASDALDQRQALRGQANRGNVSHTTYWDRHLLLHGVTNPNQRETLVNQIVDYSNHVITIPGGREAMAGLKQRGFILGIVTDTMYPLEWKMRWLIQVGVAEFVDVVACSTVLGVHKPDPVIYLDAINQAKLTPTVSAFVGHDKCELEGACKAGLATVAVNYDADAKADYYAQSLIDLLNVPIFQTAST